MKNIAVLFGGKSGEHEVSLVSASSVARNIDSAKFNVLPIGITKSGMWFLQDEDELNRIRSDENASFKIQEKNPVTIVPAAGRNSLLLNGSSLEVDVVFPVVHGTNCEDGVLQGLLEACLLPYVGCGVMASALTMDKEKTKQVWHEAGLPVVPYFCMKRTDLNDSKKYDEFFERIVSEFGFPLFVKPCNAGSSVGANRANNAKELSFALAEAFMWDNKVLIEKAIDAREIECSVTGLSELESAEKPESIVKAYTPGEILPTHAFYDYDAKYNDPNGAALKIPAGLDQVTSEKIRALAVKAYKVLDASGLSRVDFFVERKSGEIYLNEINTIPGFTSISMFPKMCAAAGLDYRNLISLLIDEAVLRFEARQKLSTSY